MKYVIISAILLILTGFTAGVELPETPGPGAPGFEQPNMPSTSPDFNSNIEYSYSSDLIEFNTSESIQTDIYNDVPYSDNSTEENKSETNSTQPSESDNNTEEENTSREETDTSSSSTGGSSYSPASIEVGVGEGDEEPVNETDNEENQSSSENQSQNNQNMSRVENGLFDGPWAESDNSGSSLQDRLTGRFSQSETMGGVTAIVFAGLILYSIKGN